MDWTNVLKVIESTIFAAGIFLVMLRPFKVRPKRVRSGDEVRRGYHLDQFEVVFARYLSSPEDRQQPSTSGTTAPHSHADVPDVDGCVTPEEAGLFGDIDPDPGAPAPLSE